LDGKLREIADKNLNEQRCKKYKKLQFSLIAYSISKIFVSDLFTLASKLGNFTQVGVQQVNWNTIATKIFTCPLFTSSGNTMN
jgi:hypothetical protein